MTKETAKMVVFMVLIAVAGTTAITMAPRASASNTPANYERRILRALETIADEQEKQSRCVCK